MPDPLGRPITPPTASPDGKKLGDGRNEQQWTPDQYVWVTTELFDKGTGFLKVAKQAKEKWPGIKISKGQLERLWRLEQDRLLKVQAELNRIREDARNANDIAETARRGEPGLKEGTIAVVRQVAFNMLRKEGVKAKDIVALVKALAIPDREARADAQLEVEKQKLDLLLKKAAQADAAKEVVQSTLTPEEQRARLREILA